MAVWSAGRLSAAGLCRRPARAASVCGIASKASRNNRCPRCWGVLSRYTEKSRFLLTNKIPKELIQKKTLSIKKTEKVHFSLQISENGVSKSILKELQKLIFSLRNSEKTCFFPNFLEVFKALESHFSLFDP